MSADGSGTTFHRFALRDPMGRMEPSEALKLLPAHDEEPITGEEALKRTGWPTHHLSAHRLADVRGPDAHGRYAVRRLPPPPPDSPEPRPAPAARPPDAEVRARRTDTEQLNRLIDDRLRLHGLIAP